jgi:hypothetical protein
MVSGHRTRYSTPGMQIVKVQLPQQKDDNGDWIALIYGKGREHYMTQKVDQQTRSQMGMDYLAYFYASWEGHRWVLGSRCEGYEKEADW